MVVSLCIWRITLSEPQLLSRCPPPIHLTQSHPTTKTPAHWPGLRHVNGDTEVLHDGSCSFPFLAADKQAHHA